MVEVPGVPSADLVRALTAVDPAGLDEADLLAVIAGWERVRSFVQACQNDAFLAYERLLCPPVGSSHLAQANHRFASEELGLALRVSGPSVWRRVMHAVTLVEKLPRTTAALRSGRISVTHAEKAAVRSRNLPPVVAREVDRAVMSDPDWRTPSALEKTFAAQILQVDPAGAADRAREARRQRGVRKTAEEDAMSTLSAYLPAADAEDVYSRLDAHARSSKATNTPGDDRTLDERRADALVDIVCHRSGDSRGPTPTRHGRAPQIHVTVSWSTLIGLDELPANLAGYGDIDADTARRLAADPHSVWRRLLLDPLSGRLMDYGTTTYKPPQDLVDFVTARDTTCRFPGCETPAVACDLDHRTPYGTCGGTRKPRPALPKTPPPETRRQLDPPPRPRHRRQHLDQPPRPRLRHTRPRPAHPETRRETGTTATRGRSRPATVLTDAWCNALRM